MTKLEKVIKALELEIQYPNSWDCRNECQYYGKTDCDCYTQVSKDALELLEATNPAKLMSALYDVRDRWIARLPKSEWYRDKRAQGVEQGIEMCIQRMSEVLYGNE